MFFWDWRSGYNFQKLQTQVQPGSIDSEAGIFDVQFDHSGARLLTAEADKTIKIYKEDDSAVSLEGGEGRGGKGRRGCMTEAMKEGEIHR